MVQIVEPVDFSMAYDKYNSKLNLINKLVVASEITIAYLRSLDMHLILEVAKKEEINKKEIELKAKEDALKIKNEEVESMRKVYQELVNIKRGLPELIRSTITEEIKKSHREIEKYTNPNTKSQG